MFWGYRVKSKLLLAFLVTGAVTASAIPCSAGSVDISGIVNSDLTGYTGGSVYPQNGGPFNIGGIDFDLATIAPDNHTAVAQLFADPGLGPQSFTLPVNLSGVGTVYTIVNSAFGSFGSNAGSITFNTASNSFTYNYVEGDNVRDHATTGFNVIAPNVYATHDFGNGDRLDVQKIVLPALIAGDTILSIVFSYTAGLAPGDGEAFLAAITTAPAASAVPLPAALPLFATGLGVLGWTTRRRKQKPLAA